MHTSNFPRNLLAAVVALVACSSSPGPTSGFVPTHVAQVTGQALSSTGGPLDSVRVGIAPPAGQAGAYSTTVVTTNAAGEFSITLQRFTARTAPPGPDTVRVVVSAQVLKHAFLVSGVGAILRDTILLTMTPVDETPASQFISFTFTPPA
jgi:hypothetical protein